MTDQAGTRLQTEDAPPGERRNAVAVKVRGVRERLTSRPGAQPAFDHELLLAYSKNQTGIALAVPLLAVIITAMTTFWVSWSEAAVWLAGVLIGNGVLTFVCRRYQVSNRDRPDARTWQRRFVAAEFFNGSLWAIMAFLQVPAGDSAPMIFMFAVLIVSLSLRTLTASNLPIASLAGTLPITGAIVLRYSLLGEPIYLAMAGLAVGAQLFFVIIARQFHSTVLEMFGLRAEKDALIGELEHATAQSEEARRRAEEANLAKSRFLATMSHELRTPLNAVLGFSEVLKDEILGKHAVAAYKEYSADIHHSGEHLLNLINEILDLSRIEAGRYALNEEAVSLPETVADCHHLLKLRADQRDITIREDFEADLPSVRADERAIRQIVLNLLTNAIKFSPNGSTVVLTVGWTSGGGQYLSVRDNGPGIPEEEVPTVLQTFGRGSLAAQNAEEGSGLGLPIVVKLVNLHGGRFDLRSRLREGTEVVVVLPKSRVMSQLPMLDEADEPTSSRLEGTRRAA